MKTVWSVVIVHEDKATREAAVKFCDCLVERFWSQHEFELSWWSFAQLDESSGFKEASEKAVRTNLIVFAMSPEGQFPNTAQRWIDSWLVQRGEREGAIVGLLDPAPRTAEKYVYLRNLAHRSGMDYLTQVPEEIHHPIPDSLDSYHERAHRVTNVLDAILHQSSPRG